LLFFVIQLYTGNFLDLAGLCVNREEQEHFAFKYDGIFLLRMSTAITEVYLGWL